MLVPWDGMASTGGTPSDRNVLQPVYQLLQNMDHLVGYGLHHLCS